jgi:hypothetical protein
MLPVLGRTLVEGQQALSVLLQRLGRLRISGRIERHEAIERGVRVGAGRHHPDRLHVGFCARLRNLGISFMTFPMFMESTALATRGRKHLFRRCPQIEPFRSMTGSSTDKATTPA